MSSIKIDISNISKMPHFKRDLFLLVVVVPVILSLVFLLPESTKTQLILNKNSPQLPTLFTSHFVHLDADHFLGNVIFYIILVIPVYTLNLLAGQVRKFYFMVLSFFFLLPFLISIADLLLVPGNASSLGFSGIVSAFLGFLPYSALMYFKKTCNWKVGILPFLNIIIFFTFGIVALTYFVSTLYILILLAIVWGLFFGFAAMVVRNASLKKSLSSIKYALGKKKLLQIVPIIYLIGLASLFPKKIIIGNNVVGIHIHYFGFIFGFFVPYIFIIQEFRRKKK